MLAFSHLGLGQTGLFAQCVIVFCCTVQNAYICSWQLPTAQRMRCPTVAMSQPNSPSEPPTAKRGEILLDYAWFGAALFFGGVLAAKFAIMDSVDAVMYGVGTLLGAFMFSFRRQQRKRLHAAAQSAPQMESPAEPQREPNA
jgi:hypothetical protein